MNSQSDAMKEKIEQLKKLLADGTPEAPRVTTGSHEQRRWFPQFSVQD